MRLSRLRVFAVLLLTASTVGLSAPQAQTVQIDDLVSSGWNGRTAVFRCFERDRWSNPVHLDHLRRQFAFGPDIIRRWEH